MVVRSNRQASTHIIRSIRYFAAPLCIPHRRKINLGVGFEAVDCPPVAYPDLTQILDPKVPFYLTFF